MKLDPVTLEGDVVRLEPLTLDHLDGLCAVGLDPSLWAYNPHRVVNRDDMLGWLRKALAERDAGTVLPFATIDRNVGAIVGSTRFLNAVPEHRRVEIGATWVAPAAQRTAVNTEAKFLMLRHAFEEWCCRRVELKTNALNTRSRTAIRRIGFTEEGTLRQHMLNWDGSSRDSVYFSMLDGEWPAARARLSAMLRR